MPGASIDVTVNVTNGVHAINPLIYGAAFCPNSEYIRVHGVTANRWGGNHSSRYNWEISAANKDHDWYYHNFAWGEDPFGQGLTAWHFVASNMAAGAAGGGVLSSMGRNPLRGELSRRGAVHTDPGAGDGVGSGNGGRGMVAEARRRCLSWVMMPCATLSFDTQPP
jgi:hypothetical protein